MKVFEWSLAQQVIHERERRSLIQVGNHYHPCKRHCLICEKAMPRHGKKPKICLCENHNLKVRNLMRAGSTLEMAVAVLRSEWKRLQLIEDFKPVDC